MKPRAAPVRTLADLEGPIRELQRQGASLTLEFLPRSRPGVFQATIARQSSATFEGGFAFAKASTAAQAETLAQAIADAIALWGDGTR